MKKRTLIMLSFVAAALPIFVNIIFRNCTIASAPNLGNAEWLDFWGSYLGAFMGCIPAVLALQESRKQAKQQYEDSEKNRRLSALPVFSCKSNSLSFISGQLESVTTLSGLFFLKQELGFYGQFHSINVQDYTEKALEEADASAILFFEFHNIGAGPALNVSLACSNISASRPIPIQSIGCNETKTIIFAVCIPPNAAADYEFRYNIAISFSDVLGNKYVQFQPLLMRKAQHALAEISTPQLIG